MPALLPSSTRPTDRMMLFVDGENLANRYSAELGVQERPTHVIFRPGIYAWSPFAGGTANQTAPLVRQHYYTSAVGDTDFRRTCEQELRAAGIQAPRVFRRTKKRGSKRVDISLTTEMLTQAHRRNFDIGILVAGDEDYVPLVDAVKAEGRVVVLWFVESGMSAALRAAADHYWDLRELLFDSPEKRSAFYNIWSQ